MSSVDFNVAIAGFGWWGRHISTRLAGHPRISVASVIEPNQALHAEIGSRGHAALPDLDAALGDPSVDAVILTTPNPVHEAQVIACAKAGKHVFCEKPLGLTAASARRSIAAVERAGVQLGIGHERRFEPGLQQLRDALDAGRLGTVMHAEAAFSHDKLKDVPKGDWRTSKEVAPAAGMTGMGVHLTDLFISYFGEVETVQAMVGHRVLGWETGDVVTAQLGFKAGMTATLSAILCTPHFIRTHVFGSERWVEVRNESHPDSPGGRVSYTEAASGADPVTEWIAWSDAVVANLEAFRAACRGETPYPFTAFEMRHNIEVLEAIALSADDRRTVQIGELR